MLNQLCAICQKNDFQILYKKNFKIEEINAKIFSARRLPDRIHYQIVKCINCGLVYSNPILPSDQIEKFYQQSFTDYQKQIPNLQLTYGYYLQQLEKYRPCKNNLLEIGCGNGFFLEEAKKQGYRQVFGVEPGIKSVDQAGLLIKKNIIVDIFRPGLFKKDFFNIICCFQTFDHVVSPDIFLNECYKILKKDGLLLFLNHDVESITAKILKENSPIFDIEHTYLFSKETIKKIFQKHRFAVLEVKNAFNIHFLSYWISLIPFPKSIKSKIQNFLRLVKLDRLPIKIYPGNLVIAGRK